MLEHAQAGVAAAGSAALADVAGLPWWAQLLIGIGGVIISFFASRQKAGPQ